MLWTGVMLWTVGGTLWKHNRVNLELLDFKEVLRTLTSGRESRGSKMMGGRTQEKRAMEEAAVSFSGEK